MSGCNPGSFPPFTNKEIKQGERHEILSDSTRRNPLFVGGGGMQQDRTHGGAARSGCHYCRDPRAGRNGGYDAPSVYDGLHHSISLPA